MTEALQYTFPKGTIPLIVVLCAIVILLSPIASWAYYRRRHAFPLKGRGWRLVLAFFATTPVFSIIVLVALFNQTTFPGWLFSTGFCFSSMTPAIIYMFRAWRLLFAFKLTEKIVEINDLVERGQFTQVQALQKDWFLRNRRWLKPSRFVPLFVIVLCSFYAAALIIVFIVRKVGTNGLFAAALTMIPLGFSLMAAWGLRRFKGDAHFIKLELSAVGGASITLLIIYVFIFLASRRLITLGLVFIFFLYIIMIVCSGVVPVYLSYKADREERLARNVEHIDAYFRSLLTDPIGLESFLKFAKSEFSSENVLFWRDIEKAHNGQIESLVDIQIHLRRVYATYVLDTSTIQVNISGESRVLLDAAFETLGKWKEDYKGELVPWITAQTEVFHLMKKDSLRRYLYSEIYQEFRSHGGARIDLDVANRKLTEHMSARPQKSQRGINTHTGSGEISAHSNKDSKGGSKGSKGGNDKVDSPRSPPSVSGTRTLNEATGVIGGTMFVYSSGHHNEIGDLFKTSDIIDRHHGKSSETIQHEALALSSSSADHLNSSPSNQSLNARLVDQGDSTENSPTAIETIRASAIEAAAVPAIDSQ